MALGTDAALLVEHGGFSAGSGLLVKFQEADLQKTLKQLVEVGLSVVSTADVLHVLLKHPYCCKHQQMRGHLMMHASDCKEALPVLCTSPLIIDIFQNPYPTAKHPLVPINAHPDKCQASVANLCIS